MVCCKSSCVHSVPSFSYENEMLHFQKLFPQGQFLKDKNHCNNHHANTRNRGHIYVPLKWLKVICHIFVMNSIILSSKITHVLRTYLTLKIYSFFFKKKNMCENQTYNIPTIMNVTLLQCLLRKSRFKVDCKYLHTPFSWLMNELYWLRGYIFFLLGGGTHFYHLS